MQQVRHQPENVHLQQPQNGSHSLNGHDRMAFSINQILSPVPTDTSSTETRENFSNTPQCQFDDNSPQPKSMQGNMASTQNSGYIYPQISNYWKSDFYNNQLYNKRLGNHPGFYHHGGYNSQQRDSGLYGQNYQNVGLKPSSFAGADLTPREFFSNSYSYYDYNNNKQPNRHLGQSSYDCSRNNQLDAEVNNSGLPNNSFKFGKNEKYSNMSYHNDSGCTSDGHDDKRSSAGRSDSSTADLHSRAENSSRKDNFYGIPTSSMNGGLRNGNQGPHSSFNPLALATNSQLGSDPAQAQPNSSYSAAHHQAAAIAAINDPANRLLKVSAQCNFHRPPLLSNTFPWMESRRERIARESRFFLISKNQG